MSRIPVMNSQGQNVGDVEIADELLVLKRGKQALHEVIVAFQAGLRAGTASTLTKAQVAGSNRKPWAQKGLGRARAGYRRSPIWRGGGVVFGPHPRDYSKHVPRNVSRLAFRRALSEKVASGAIRVIDELALAAPKTKAMTALLKTLNLTGVVLIVLDKADRKVTLAVRNIPKVAVALAREIHPYQLVRYSALLVTRSGMAVLEQRLKAAAGGA
ncbi:MAG: 50S ribosomal protein L4 [Verrucomicrobia bacterium]|nr:50S ribosomal protein L4 [Verrucomicrobiota bacterium]MCG2679014.1 50S ribosomal protein L4 [Kiritimatiellia bacterium]MBU4248366.1 50S ribosomal protein L4 [Verrucomicrobiota bacterium]MBU4289751.1 50S ribosomal protein L4 [Verrucomicrobiota bacterium]MBU4428535.1 50S ribosomal protein L4 [Verrucomicrobiota bacterium]